MIDLSLTIAPKSDHLTGDDLIGGARVVRITEVRESGDKDRPIDIGFDGDAGRPFRPCKIMRRVLVAIWGKDGHSYVGRTMTLYRDEAVKFGALEVGGIRISHMSDMTRPVTLALTVTRQNKRPYTVEPLIEAPASPAKAKPRAKTFNEWLDELQATLECTHSLAEVNAVLDGEDVLRMVPVLRNGSKMRYESLRKAALARFVEDHQAPADDEPPAADPFQDAIDLAS